MGGAALISAVKYMYVCMWEERGRGSVCVDIWVRKAVWGGAALIAAVKYMYVCVGGKRGRGKCVWICGCGCDCVCVCVCGCVCVGEERSVWVGQP